MYLIHVETAKPVRLANGITIGRAEHCDLVIRDRSVSRQHAYIQAVGSAFQLVDAGSRSGTFVGGQRVERVRLAPGTMLLLGRAHVLVSSDAGGQSVEDHTMVPVTPIDFQSAHAIKDPDRLRSDYERLRAIFELTRSLDAHTGLQDMLKHILRTALRLLPAERGLIELFEHTKTPFRFSETQDGRPTEILLSQTLLKKVIEKRCGLIVDDAQLDERFDASISIIAGGVRSIMCVPLFYKDEALGIMLLDSAQDSHIFEAQDLTLFQTMATHAALVIQDLSLREQMLKVEIAARNRLEQVLDAMPCGVALVDERGRAQLYNRMFNRMLLGMGYPSVNKLLKTPLWLRAQDSPVELRPPTRPEACYTLVSSPSFEGERVLVIQDVSELRSVQDKEAHQARLALLGQIAGGIAHDFNSLLTVIINGAELLTEMSDDPEINTEAKAVAEAGERAGRLVKQLLTYSRRDSATALRFLPDARIHSSLDLLERTLPGGVALHRNLLANPSELLMDPNHLDRVIMNLVNNARDALKGHGQIAVRTRRIVLESERFSEGRRIPPGHYVLIEVEDNGPGMNAETAAKLFEPFFTTKPAGQGTGLGLATVLGIVERYHGHVIVKSAPNKGSLFRLLIPSAEDRLSDNLEIPHAP